MVAAALGVSVGVAVAGPAVLVAAGFTPAGVAVGSAAAAWQVLLSIAKILGSDWAFAGN